MSTAAIQAYLYGYLQKSAAASDDKVKFEPLPDRGPTGEQPGFDPGPEFRPQQQQMMPGRGQPDKRVTRPEEAALPEIPDFLRRLSEMSRQPQLPPLQPPSPGRMVNLAKEVLPHYYGTAVDQEIEAADAYNKSIGAPYRMGQLREPVQVYEGDGPPVRKQDRQNWHESKGGSYYATPTWLGRILRHKPHINVAGSRNLQYQQQTTRRDTRVVNGFNPDHDFTTQTPEDARGELLHEGIHAATAPTVRADRQLQSFLRSFQKQAPHPDPHVGRGKYPEGANQPPTAASTYPEMSWSEMMPPLSAIQRHLFQTTGSRITSPEAYDTYVQQWDSIPAEQFEEALKKLPLEAQRFHRYRRTMHTQELGNDAPMTESASKRLRWYDQRNRRLVPGLVNRQTNDRHTRTA